MSELRVGSDCFPKAHEFLDKRPCTPCTPARGHREGGMPLLDQVVVIIFTKIISGSRCSRSVSVRSCRIENSKNTQTGWWLGHPSEKYDFVNWDDQKPNINGKITLMATKPPSSYLFGQHFSIHLSNIHYIVNWDDDIPNIWENKEKYRSIGMIRNPILMGK